MSVFELAWLYGLGGYHGKANWVEDKDSSRPALYNAMPDCVKAPWVSSRNEIRVMDVAAKNAEEFQAYLLKFTGREQRFLEPCIPSSADVKLSHRSQLDLFTYVLNYNAHDRHYSEAQRNCQHFAADFFSALTNTKVKPYAAICRTWSSSCTNRRAQVANAVGVAMGGVCGRGGRAARARGQGVRPRAWWCSCLVVGVGCRAAAGSRTHRHTAIPRGV